jgi:hypothetical protein
MRERERERERFCVRESKILGEKERDRERERACQNRRESETLTECGRVSL